MLCEDCGYETSTLIQRLCYECHHFNSVATDISSLILGGSMEEELRGHVLDEQTLINAYGKQVHIEKPIRKEYVGKQVVIRGDKVTERIDS